MSFGGANAIPSPAVGRAQEASEPRGAENSETFSTLSASEEKLLLEILQAARAIRYGSVTATFHEGRVVEIVKTKRIRIAKSVSEV
jgi:hypothetical protein